jgi:hypothetical protein
MTLRFAAVRRAREQQSSRDGIDYAIRPTSADFSTVPVMNLRPRRLTVGASFDRVGKVSMTRRSAALAGGFVGVVIVYAALSRLWTDTDSAWYWSLEDRCRSASYP